MQFPPAQPFFCFARHSAVRAVLIVPNFTEYVHARVLFRRGKG